MTSRFSPWLERVFALDEINAIYDHCAPGGADGFLDRALDYIGLAWRVSAEDLAKVPARGPLVVVANHPFGAVEGMILAVMLRKVRPDVKVMANFLLGRIPELRDLFLCVDPFGGDAATARNLGPMRQALRWLKQGGALAVFPAGEVAHLDLKQGGVVEPRWSDSVAGLVRRSGAAVLPVYFDGNNGPLFHLLGLVHPRLRTAMLPRQVMNKSGRTIAARVGTAIPSRRLAAIEEDAAMIEYLRQRMLLLRHRQTAPAPANAQVAKAEGEMEPVVEPADRTTLAAEVAALPPGQLLTDGGEFRVYVASAVEAPAVVREIGRLREVTYRATGEGTGKPIDLDAFDNWYQHLFVWDAAGEQVVGAYRLGCTDAILRQQGPGGLYTSTLFDYKPQLLARLNPAIELGRAFVRTEFQKSYAPLLLLWKGIARFVCLHPRYKTLFGPVSISNDYQLASRQLMVEFLRSNHLAPDLTDLARARNPFREPAAGSRNRLHVDPADIDDVVADLEPDRKGVPVLLRQYLKLGARFFSFNVDAGFGNAIDALMLVDLTQTDERILDRYMGKADATQFRAYHRSASKVGGLAVRN